jgi:hypothetical protein
MALPSFNDSDKEVAGGPGDPTKAPDPTQDEVKVNKLSGDFSGEKKTILFSYTFVSNSDMPNKAIEWAKHTGRDVLLAITIADLKAFIYDNKKEKGIQANETEKL